MTWKRVPLLIAVAAVGTGLLTVTMLGAAEPDRAGRGRLEMAAGFTSSVLQNGVRMKVSAATARTRAGNRVPLTITISTRTSRTVLVDVEAYSARGRRVFQQVWSRQSLTAERAQTWTTTWTAPAVPGRYRIAVGVFSDGWAAMLAWNGQAVFVVVAPAAPGLVPPDPSSTAPSELPPGPADATVVPDATPGTGAHGPSTPVGPARPRATRRPGAPPVRSGPPGATARPGATAAPGATAGPGAGGKGTGGHATPAPSAAGSGATSGAAGGASDAGDAPAGRVAATPRPDATSPAVPGAAPRPGPGALPAVEGRQSGAGFGPTHFGTLSPGTALPDDDECAAWVQAVPTPPEIRPANARAAATEGAPLADASGLLARVDGRFTGTTEQVLRWAACKWGIDEDVVKAQAAVESGWRAGAVGDWTTDGDRCAPGHPQGADGRPGECPESVGLLQVSYPDHQVAFPRVATSAALNADYALASWRECFVGDSTWLDTVDHTGAYAAGDAWGCVGVWSSGRWHTPAADAYVAEVKAALQRRSWTTSAFLEA